MVSKLSWIWRTPSWCWDNWCPCQENPASHAGIGFQNHTTHINPFKPYNPIEQAFWCLLHMRLRFRETEELASGRAGVWTPNNHAEGLRTVAGSVGRSDWPWGGPQGSPDTHGPGTCNLAQKSVPNQSEAFVRNLGLKAHSRVCRVKAVTWTVLRLGSGCSPPVTLGLSGHLKSLPVASESELASGQNAQTVCKCGVCKALRWTWFS